MATLDIASIKALGKNRQWILDARPVGKLTGKEFRWHEASIPNAQQSRWSDERIYWLESCIYKHLRQRNEQRH
jgi:hypothetical protein